MAVIRFRSPVTKPLLRADQPLPADRTSVFRVTQHFDSRDFYWNDGRTHSATDIGDFGCGSPLVAMADGTAFRIKDNASQIQPGASDALGVRIDHGEIEPGVRITTEIWHMAGWTFTDGPIKAGQQVGMVGNTGLGAVCHAHVEAKRNGVKFDPEPLMFGGSVGEDDMNLPPSLEPMAAGTFPTNLAIRSSPQVPANPEANVLERLTADTRLGILFPLAGQGGYLGPDNTVRRDWFATGIGPGSGVLAYVAAAYGSNVMLTDAGRRYVTQASSGFTLTQLNDAKKATADKANAQMDAWTAGRPRIVP